MQISKEAIQEYKEIYKKRFGKDLCDKEAYEQASRLLGFFEILYEGVRKEAIRKAKLEKHPNGFHLDDGVYSCLICHKEISGKDSWYDKFGQKCLDCQRAVEKKIVPGYVCKNRDSWYAMWELKDKFGIHPATAKKMIREGNIKARIIKDGQGKNYFYVFLFKENRNFLKNNY